MSYFTAGLIDSRPFQSRFWKTDPFRIPDPSKGIPNRPGLPKPDRDAGKFKGLSANLHKARVYSGILFLLVKEWGVVFVLAAPAGEARLAGTHRPGRWR